MFSGFTPKETSIKKLDELNEFFYLFGVLESENKSQKKLKKTPYLLQSFNNSWFSYEFRKPN